MKAYTDSEHNAAMDRLAADLKDKGAHTPGPWHYNPPEYECEGEYNVRGGGMRAIVWASLQPAADARLIAAAPDLAEACKAFMNCGLIATDGRTTDGKPSNCTCRIHPELDAAMVLARAALAKAGL